MRHEDIIKAWKDPVFRTQLDAAASVDIPANPAGEILPVDDSALYGVAGASTEHVLTVGCCPGLTTDPGICSMFCPSVGCSMHYVCPPTE